MGFGGEGSFSFIHTQVAMAVWGLHAGSGGGREGEEKEEGKGRPTPVSCTCTGFRLTLCPGTVAQTTKSNLKELKSF